MRLWHKYLIPVLPKQQLLGQWRECCAIAHNIAVKGTPNHILVNKIMDYPLGMFTTYTRLVRDEMTRRGYKISKQAFYNYKYNIDRCSERLDNYNIIETGPINTLYKDWHDYRYLQICYFNLLEKYNCGGISDIEFEKVTKTYLNSFYGKQAAGS